MNTRHSAPTHDDVIAATRVWIERAVIGLNLCPFAKAVYTKNQIRYTVSDAETSEALLGDLERELHFLAQAAPEAVDTTLLLHPRVLGDFLDYNDFLDVADAAVDRLGLTGVIQVASFHPDYQFAGTTPKDITNYTNRSPYPMLHLLREASVAQALATFPEAEDISQNNIETMHRIGIAGWEALGLASPAVRKHSPIEPGGHATTEVSTMRQLNSHSLWLGSAAELRDLRVVLAAGIAAIVDLAADEPPVRLIRDLVYCRIPLCDGASNESWLMRVAIDTTASFVRSRVPTLVCCSAGMSRSPAIAAAGLARALGQSPEECLAFVTKSGASDVSPGLWQQVLTELSSASG